MVAQGPLMAQSEPEQEIGSWLEIGGQVTGIIMI